jgi:predicted aminopeptidase
MKNNRIRTALRWLILYGLVLIMVSSCVGCSQLGYYAQGVQGHLALMSQRESIAEVLDQNRAAVQDRAMLQSVLSLRDFAWEQLGLPENGSYRNFVNLEGEAVVWNVVATPAFDIKPKEWCFPIAGCVSYRGYFSHLNALKFAAKLRDDGYDAAINPVPAYSTLGWFDDPVLSTMMRRGEILLAETIFHELAHQRLYVKNDSVFNEAFASAVGEAGVRVWLASLQREDDLVRYESHLDRKEDFLTLLRQTADQLRVLYRQKLPEAELRKRKADIFANLKSSSAELKQNTWQGYAGYDRWFDRELNNAHLAAIAVYRDRVPDFERWMVACEGNFERFYAAMDRLAALDKSQRHSRLRGPADCNVEKVAGR